MKKCKECNREFIENLNYPENDLCKECYLKWKEKALKCKSCKKPIDWHNYYWHNKLCDECYNSV